MIIQVFAGLFILGILVFVHELGHFLAAKWVGVKVLTFSIFMGKKVIRKKIGDTEYCLSAIPFGGYVKLLGQEDLPNENMALKGSVDEYPSRKVWERALIIFAGPLMNFLFSIFVLWAAFMIGVPAVYPPQNLVIGYLPDSSSAQLAGLLVYDRITAVDGISVKTWEEFQIRTASSEGESVALSVMRDGELHTYKVAPHLDEKFKEYFIKIGGYYPAVVRGLIPNMPAVAAGLCIGDTIIRFNQTQIGQEGDLIQAVENNGAKPASVFILRGSDTLNLALTPKFEPASQRHLLGIHLRDVIKVGPLLALGHALKRTGQDVTMMFRHLKKLIWGEYSIKLMSGPVGIVNYTSKIITFGIIDILIFIALISTNLAIVNLFPFLIITDGGHLFFLLLEKLRGNRPLSKKVQLGIQRFGITMIMILAVVITYNDILKLFRK